MSHKIILFIKNACMFLCMQGIEELAINALLQVTSL